MTANPYTLYTIADELRIVADVSLRFSKNIDRERYVRISITWPSS